MRPVARIVPFVLLPLFLTGAGPLPSATAGGVVNVTIDDNFFAPASVAIKVGNQVHWTNEGNLLHTATSDQAFFNTPDLGNGDDASRIFPDAGKFAYHCAHHPLSMSGVVKVRMRKAGSPADGWTIRWSTRSSTPDIRGYDVQVKRPGSSSFEAFRTNTQTRSANFDPARSGTYGFRVRTDNRSNDESSGFSPVLSVVIS